MNAVRCVRTAEWSRVVKGRKNRVDHENRHTGAPKSQLVRRSTPISYCRASRQEREQEQSCSIEYRYGFTPDRLTTAALSRRRGAVSLVNPSNRRVDHPDHNSGEVTL